MTKIATTIAKLREKNRKINDVRRLLANSFVKQLRIHQSSLICG
jgi:hypothetical protein